MNHTTAEDLLRKYWTAEKSITMPAIRKYQLPPREISFPPSMAKNRPLRLSATPNIQHHILSTGLGRSCNSDMQELSEKSVIVVTGSCGQISSVERSTTTSA
jgi:hypothetical protein